MNQDTSTEDMLRNYDEDYRVIAMLPNAVTWATGVTTNQIILYASEAELDGPISRQLMVKRLRQFSPIGRINFSIKPPKNAIVITSQMNVEMDCWQRLLESEAAK